ncbi:MAG: S1 RNA-binding domain-containing protein, partial [Mucinivorans sp.]
DTLSAPREDYKPHVPRIVQIVIPGDFIGAIIGPGGKVIQEMQKTTGTTITITEADGKGIVDVFGANKAGVDAAIERIKGITAVPEVGTIYTGKIRTIVEFGAFVEILPGKDGLLHISEIANHRIEKMTDSGLKEGEMIEVKLIGVDAKNGKLKLSRRVLLDK